MIPAHSHLVQVFENNHIETDFSPFLSLSVAVIFVESSARNLNVICSSLTLVRILKNY